jgi:predicted TIM-barrel fold metal-dependent hydrolase
VVSPVRFPAPVPTGQRPIFDAHLHIIDARFPLVPNQGYTPEPFDVAAYRRRTAALQVTGGAVVSGSFQGYDQTYLLDALRRLGPGFVGVTQLPATVTDQQIRSLHAAGVRGLRCNLYRGGGHDLDEFGGLAARVADLAGWHVELYVDARDLPDLDGRLARLPAFSVDHLGLSRDGLPALLRLVERGVAVKASGFSRGDLDVPTALTAIAAANPRALLFGTDLPSTRAPSPFADSDAALVLDVLGEELGCRALHDNAMAFYRLESSPELGLRPGEVEVTAEGTGIRVESPAGDRLTERQGRTVVPGSGASLDDATVRALRDAEQR